MEGSATTHSCVKRRAEIISLQLPMNKAAIIVLMLILIVITSLILFTLMLQDGKADRSWAMAELDTKADKNLLDAKVSQHAFERGMEEINRTLADILTRLGLNEETVKEALENINKELDSKLDRMELEPLRYDGVSLCSRF